MLKKECVLASLMGFKVLVLDDIALQCNANDKKGSISDFNFSDFVSQIQAIGMRVGIQFSVPYCGEKTKTYEQFKGKFLTENHNLGTILDPRYPEIREHLVQLYTKALKEYKIDGFKFDFINLLHHYEDTPELEGNYLSINDAVNCLLNDITTSLLAINPDVFIAFNQEFVSPAMRKYGNMLCGVNCFGDFELQRVRIADMRMLCGDTATHSALNTWHPNEAVEITAIKLIPSLFGVPQVNIAFLKAGYETINTVRFYMEYWNNNAAILLSTNFKPYNPLDNYPYQKATLHKQVIISISGNHTVPIDEEKEIIHLFNTKLSTEIELNCPLNFGEYSALIYNCQGVLQYHKILNLNNTVLKIDVPAGGMIQMKKTKKLE